VSTTTIKDLASLSEFHKRHAPDMYYLFTGWGSKQEFHYAIFEENNSIAKRDALRPHFESIAATTLIENHPACDYGRYRVTDNYTCDFSQPNHPGWISLMNAMIASTATPPLLTEDGDSGGAIFLCANTKPQECRYIGVHSSSGVTVRGNPSVTYNDYVIWFLSTLAPYFARLSPDCEVNYADQYRPCAIF